MRWDAIETTLEILGVDGTYRELVMACVKTTSVSALVEDSPTKIIKQKRGLRQDDPLSPLLFVVVIDCLSRLVSQATRSKNIELYSSGGVTIESHLAFTDNIAFFCRASTKSFRALREVLTEFTEFSGLSINCGKSYAIFSKRVGDGAELVDILGFQTKEMPIRYLGTPLTGKLVRYKDCDGLLAELRGILMRWSAKKLSYADRTQLIDWVFQGKFGYLIQSSIIPQAALDAIQTITHQFIWGSQRDVAWKNMVKTKKHGGMGVHDYKSTQLTAIVGRACRMWELEGIWSS